VLAYLVRRIIAALLTLVLVVTSVFVIFFVLPGGLGYRLEEAYTSPIVVLLAGKRIQDRAYVERLQEELNLGVPLTEQYTRYMGLLLRGDLGYDYRYSTPVSGLIRSAFPPTFSLIVGAVTIWFITAIVAGGYAARHRGTREDRAILVGATTFMSLPVFFTALFLAYLGARHGWYTIGSYVPLSDGFFAHASAMWLPWLVLASMFVGRYVRFIRAHMLEVANEDFVRTAEAKGLRGQGIARHQLRASLVPVASLTGLDVSTLFVGVILIEPIFGLPGLGGLLGGAINGLDFPILAGVTLTTATIIVTLSLAVDLVYALLDPRIRLHERRA